MPSGLPLLDAAGRRRSPATMPGFGAGKPPCNKGRRYPADPPTIDEIVAVMRHAVTPLTKWNGSLTSTPRSMSSVRAASMSVTTKCIPRYEPGAAVLIPVPKEIEQADPGGVSCTTRKFSPARWSTSTTKPSLSA